MKRNLTFKNTTGKMLNIKHIDGHSNFAKNIACKPKLNVVKLDFGNRDIHYEFMNAWKINYIQESIFEEEYANL